MDNQNDKNSNQAEWKVTYDGGFWSDRGRAGKEILLGKDFFWGDEHWYVPAVYSCSKGLVVDYCIQVENTKVKAFIEKWNLSGDREEDYTEREQDLIRQEHPLNIDFHSEIELNGALIGQEQLYGMVWIAESCLKENKQETDEKHNEGETEILLKHYGYNLEHSWAIRRVCYPWKEKRPRAIKSFELKLKRELNEVYGTTFQTKTAKEDILIKNPIDGKDHHLIVRTIEKQKLNQNFFQDTGLEYPTHFMVMTYTLYPEIEKFQIRDCCRGDSPRQKKENPHGPAAVGVCVIGGVTGGAGKNECTEQYIYPNGKAAKPYTVCSSMHFEEADEVLWETVFYEKRVPDLEIKLI